MGLILFIIAVVAFIVALLALVGAVMIDGDDRAVPLGFMVVAGLVGIVLTFASMVTVVQAKTIGVQVTFGHVSTSTLDSGFHLKKPWTKVVKIDGTIQSDEYRDRGEKVACGGAISVRIGDGSRSCLTLTNRWSVNGKRADRMYQDFRSNDPTEQFRSAVVSTQLKAAAQKVLAEYNPVAQLRSVGGADSAADINFAPDYDAISTALTEEMRTRVGELADIRSVTVSYLSLSEKTQTKLDSFIAAVGDTRIATQRQETAKAEAKANELLAASVSHDPNVLVSKCLDLLASGWEAPAGFTCWPGGNSAVVVPSAK